MTTFYFNKCAPNLFFLESTPGNTSSFRDSQSLLNPQPADSWEDEADKEPGT